MQNSHVLKKKQYPGNFRSSQNDSRCPHRWHRPQGTLIIDESWQKCGEINASFVKPSRELDTRAQALLFGTWHRLLIFFSFLQRNLCDTIGRHAAPWRIWLVDFSPTSLVRKPCLAFQVSESRAQLFEWVDAPVLGQFLFDFVRI